jgi:hypothetical protein
MAITVKYLEDLGVEKEVAEKIFAERSKEIEADKAKREAVETKLKEAEKSLESLTTEIDTLKTSGKNAEEIQAKLDALIAEREAEKTKAEADRIMKEKQENILNRFKAVVGDKKFSHSAIEEAYLKKFGEALESKDFEGQSDEQIMHALSKDDATAFTGVTAVKLQGGTPLGNGTKYTSKADIMAIKDRTERRNAIAQNLDLFEKGE